MNFFLINKKGVFFISQPSILFKKILTENLKNSIRVDQTSAHGSIDASNDSSTTIIIGVTFALLAAIFSSIVMVLIKKLNNHKVHYSIVIIYACYCGLPLNLMLSLVGELTNVMKPRDPLLYASWTNIFEQCGYSLASGVGGTLSQVFVNISLKYEDASKISVYRTTDILFTFLLQIVVLNIVANFLSVIGALCILCATLLVMMYRIAEKAFNKSIKHSDSISCWKRFVFFKFWSF